MGSDYVPPTTGSESDFSPIRTDLAGRDRGGPIGIRLSAPTGLVTTGNQTRPWIRWGLHPVPLSVT